MKSLRNARGIGKRDITERDGNARRVVGYVRVSTDMQAADGLSLDVQAAAIQRYCAAQGYGDQFDEPEYSEPKPSQCAGSGE